MAQRVLESPYEYLDAILDRGIFGWRETDENLVLASLLTGDPLLLIGNRMGNVALPASVYCA